MSDPIRIGIFGGFRGMAFYDSVMETPGFTVTAVAEKNPETRKQIKKKLAPSTTLCESFDELLSVGVDAVILANFFHQHGAYAIRAMEAGVDVISETTAAPTAGEVLDLVECAERTGRKYVLAANCPVMPGPAEMIRRYQSGELGEVEYAEAEYLHPLGDSGNEEETAKTLFPTADHWRRFLPGTYYNMHSLGVLMAATGLWPKRVTGMEIYTERHAARLHLKNNKSAGSVSLYEMDNGAIFRSTGCCGFGPAGKWYRLTCNDGTIETTRVDQDRILFRPNDAKFEEYSPDSGMTEAEMATGHGGADGRIWREIAQYLKGEKEPTFDVYRAAALSLAGIYGFYSILEGRTLDIPDIRDKSAREILRGDYRTPFPTDGKAPTIPCSIHAPLK